MGAGWADTGRMRRPSEYVPTPETADMPLTLDEIEGLVATDGGTLRRNPRALSHFLSRVRATSAHHIDQMQRAHAEVENLRSKARGRVGASTTLSPLDAVRYLTDEQKAGLFQGMQRDSYEATLRARRDAEEAAAAARKSVNLFKLKFLVLAEDPEVPQPVRERITAALAAIDAAAAAPDEDTRPVPSGLPGPQETATAVSSAEAPPPGFDEPDGQPDRQVERLSELFG